MIGDPLKGTEASERLRMHRMANVWCWDFFRSSHENIVGSLYYLLF